jgi:poly(A) polymerase/tRNA nucleotidyltransferase (CCA-adding enzyme)
MNAEGLLATPGLAPVLSALPRARLVGGCVRDMLAGREVADIDLATPDPPEAALSALEGAGLRAIPTGLLHGTVTAISNGRPFEITTLRRDEETFGRHARVSWTDDFEVDAARRDFTINAMSLDRDGVLHDYFGGAADLQAGRVRFVGDARLRVTEDYLRCLRYFRFFARYGRGEPDTEAVAAIAAGKAELASLSAERVWSEAKRIFGAPDPRAALALMARLGVLAVVLPEAGDVAAMSRLVAAGAPVDPLLRLAALLGSDAGEVAERLKLSGAERERLVALLHGKVPAAGDDDAALRRLLADEPAAILLDRLWLSGGYSEALAARIASMPRPVFPLEGRDALALGATPGPHVGQALRQVREWWMAGGCVASAEAARDRLAKALSAIAPA